MIKTDDLIDSVEAAALLGVSRVTLNRWARDGKIPIAIDRPGKTGMRLFNRSAIKKLAAKAEAAAVRKCARGGSHRKSKPGPDDVPLVGFDVHGGDKLKTA